MKKMFKSLLGVLLSVVMFAAIFATQTYAYSNVPDYFDFGDACLWIDAGSSKSMFFRTKYDYSYYVVGATSDGTYLECSFASGSQNVIFHIGADEQAKNVFFHFYVQDERVPNKDIHDCVEVYVQNIIQTNGALQVPIAGGQVGTLRQYGNFSRLFNQDNVPMASFALSYGDGRVVKYGQTNVVNFAGYNYIYIVTGLNGTYPTISQSDKEVMRANGIAGVCINGDYRNWP